jgi:hypothetical protein
MTVDFRHMILSMTVSELYMTISFCHENQFFLVMYSRQFSLSTLVSMPDEEFYVLGSHC